MRRGALLLLSLPLLLATAGSAAVAPARLTLDQALERARSEAAAAERRAAALGAAAGQSQGEVERLRAGQAAAAAAIEASEARITAADLALARANAEVARREARLAERRAPVAALLAGLANMGRQPPLLAIADGTSVDELVRVRALIDTTMPVIARRSAALAVELSDGQRLAGAAAAARSELAAGRAALAERRRRFAELEQAAAERAAALAAAAFLAEEETIGGGEQIGELGSASAAAAAARTNARRLAALDFAAPRPGHPDPRPTRAGIDYALPTSAPLVDGLGTVSPVGVRSRGLSFATPRGAALTVPADGRIAFAGPFREHDGVVIIDHGRGWTTMMINVATRLKRGALVRRGDRLGTALGDLSLELREGGTPRSAALIAGSSAKLSNAGKIR